MTRKKVTLAYITNNSERKASYKKRKKGLIKKATELTTLCGVEACVIIYSEYDAEPEVWPSRPVAEAVLAWFNSLPEMERTRKMVNRESLTRQQIRKAQDQLRRIQKENKRKELEIFMFQCLAGKMGFEGFDLRDAAEMGWVVNQIVKNIDSRMAALRRNGEAAAAAEAEVVAPPQATVGMVDARAAVEVVVPPVGEENMESFPWNLVESPTGRGLGWDDGMVLPYPYIFEHANASTSAEPKFGHGAS
ncbi:hypothetical protein CDL12_29786 [Handroanthus impetiginosus]|uniref:MADS-box domain-containing protein n=1 Tax=Handroanthus impetiginosus TaxID=429701 RepID=A0A2G9FXY2_9LAMI|nr:hypothetical protein CDL12_29786 [Handroanthus impetiginosus]